MRITDGSVKCRVRIESQAACVGRKTVGGNRRRRCACGPISRPDLGCHDEEAPAAYLQAVLWYITDNRAYAQNATGS